MTVGVDFRIYISGLPVTVKKTLTDVEVELSINTKGDVFFGPISD